MFSLGYTHHTGTPVSESSHVQSAELFITTRHRSAFPDVYWCFMFAAQFASTAVAFRWLRFAWLIWRTKSPPLALLAKFPFFHFFLVSWNGGTPIAGFLDGFSCGTAIYGWFGVANVASSSGDRGALTAARWTDLWTPWNPEDATHGNAWSIATSHGKYSNPPWQISPKTWFMKWRLSLGH